MTTSYKRHNPKIEGSHTQMEEIDKIGTLKKFKPTESNEEKRNSKRIEIRNGEGISGAIITERDLKIEVQIYDLSSNGFCLILETKIFSEQLNNSEILKLLIRNVDSNYVFECFICWSKPLSHGKTQLGLQIIRESKPSKDLIEIRNQALVLSQEFQITGSLCKQVFYRENARFKVLALSNNYIKIKVYGSEISVYESTPVKMKFFLHTGKGANILGNVINIVESTLESTILEIKLQEMSQLLQSEIVDFLIHNLHFSPEEIRKAGFKIRVSSDVYQFRFVRTHEQYLEVLKLRRNAYSGAGKISRDASLDKLAAPLDHKSRIIAAYHHNRLIGSVAITFPDSEEEILDTERALVGGFPSTFPSKLKMIEISRLCTDPDYRKGDLMLRMLQHAYRMAIIAGKEYVFTSTDQKLWPLYQGMGFKKTGESYLHPFLDNIKHYIISMHRDTPLNSRGLSPLRWYYVYGEMTEYLDRSYTVKRRWNQKIKIKLYKSIAKVLKVKG